MTDIVFESMSDEEKLQVDIDMNTNSIISCVKYISQDRDRGAIIDIPETVIKACRELIEMAETDELRGKK